MKKIVTVIMTLFITWSFTAQAAEETSLTPDNINDKTAVDVANFYGYEVSEVYNPRASIIIDSHTGQIVWGNNIDLPRHPASLSKLMTLYLVYEAIDKGQLSLDQTLVVTQKYVDIANNPELSNNNMILGVEYTVSDLIDLVLVPSSNAATIMLADAVAGNEGAFVDLMNAKAKELGMTNSIFYNSSGPSNTLLGNYVPEGQDPQGDNIVTAKDYAIMLYHFINEYPQVIEHTKNYHVTVKAGTPYEESFTGYQHSLPGAPYAYEGMDGLKTGSSGTAAYNYAATVLRNDTRFIEIILGVSDWDDDNGEFFRHLVGNGLLDYAYSNFEYKKVLSKGEQTINGQKINITEDLYDLINKNKKIEFTIIDGSISVKHDKVEYILPHQTAPAVKYQLINNTENNQSNQSKNKVFDKITQYWKAIALSGLFLILFSILTILLFKKKK